MILYLVLFTALLISHFAHADPVWSVQAPLAKNSLLLDIIRSGDRLVTVGERGHILYSDDCAATWIQVKVPTRATLTRIYSNKKNQMWAVGHDSVILRSKDNARSWELIYDNPTAEQPLFDIWFSNDLHGVAVGSYGAYLTTNNGGKRWLESTINNEEVHFYSITPFGKNNVLVSGESGTLYRSSDNGENWSLLNSPHTGSFFGALNYDKKDLLIFGLRGYVFRSHDKGISWISIKTPIPATLEAAYANAANKIYLIGHNGSVLLSEDGAESFSQIPNIKRKNYSSLTQCTSGELVLVGESGVHILSP